MEKKENLLSQRELDDLGINNAEYSMEQDMINRVILLRNELNMLIKEFGGYPDDKKNKVKTIIEDTITSIFQIRR